MNALTPAPPPVNLGIKLPNDVAALLHHLAYVTGQSKQDLVVNALRQTYGRLATATEHDMPAHSKGIK